MGSAYSQASIALSRFETLPIWKTMKRHHRSRDAEMKDYFEVREKDHSEVVSDSPMRSFMITPGTIHQILWDLIGLVLIGWDCMWLPLQLMNPSVTDLVLGVSWVSRIYWTFYVASSFLTGYFDNAG